MFPRMESIPEIKPGYRDIQVGSIFLWFMMPGTHVHAYRVVHKSPRTTDIDFKLIKCHCDQEKMNKLYREQLDKDFTPCVIGEVQTHSWEMSILRDRARWLITPAQRVLFEGK